MAIRIPSKNIYGSPQNPKVRDNVIERIEVGAVEVVPDNDYETPVYNEKISDIKNTNTYKNELSDKTLAQENVSAYDVYYGISLSGASITRIYYSGVIVVDKTQKNKYITNVFYGKDEKGNEKIKYYVKCKKQTGTCTTNGDYIFEIEGNYDDIKVSETNLYFDNIKRTLKEEKTGETLPKDEEGNLLTSYSYTQNGSYGENKTVSSTTTLNYVNETNFKLVEETEEQIKFSFSLLCGVIFDGIGYSTSGSYTKGAEVDSDIKTQKFEIEQTEGEFESYLPEQIEITVYGDTIGIDLKDKTVYIPSTDKTSKKVFRVEGNELMQTTNYIAEPSRNALQEDFGKTKKQYAKGKETATIRCSISDYYDYYIGDKVISIDKSTKRMSFVEGDQVIPMVYGADGQDHPMSLNKDGSPKVFNVLGTKKYYNGAVWQELYLQET